MRFPTMLYMCDQQSLRSACAYAQSDQCLCQSLEYSMSVKLLTEHHLEFLHLKGGCTGSSESTLVKISHCWKSHVAAHLKAYKHLDKRKSCLKSMQPSLLKKKCPTLVKMYNTFFIQITCSYEQSRKQCVPRAELDLH